MHPLRNNVAAAIGISPDIVSANHVHGAGCYGHNGADDCAMDAAIIAMQIPDRPIRVLWTRADEFGFEPLSSATMVTVHAISTATAARTISPPRSGAERMVSAPALGARHCCRPTHCQSRRRRARPSTCRRSRRWCDAQRRAALRHRRQAHAASPDLADAVRTSSLRGLGAIINIFAIESFLEELAEMAGKDAVDYRLSMLTSEPARRSYSEALRRTCWLEESRRERNRSGLALPSRVTRTSRPIARLPHRSRSKNMCACGRSGCVTDPGLAINPDGVANQLEAASFRR